MIDAGKLADTAFTAIDPAVVDRMIAASLKFKPAQGGDVPNGGKHVLKA